MNFAFCKMEIFLPEEALPAVSEALYKADAGHIGNYDRCLSFSRVTGQWRPLEGTNPYLGTVGEVCRAPEIKIEVTCRTEAVPETIRLVREAHPYEEPVINVIPLYAVGVDV